MPSQVGPEDILDVVRILPDVLFRCYKKEDGRIYWSLNEGGLAQEFGLTTAEIEGKTLDELFPGGASDELHEHFEAAFRGESTIFTNQIGDRHFRHFPKPVLDDQGNVVEVVGYIADVTDLIRTQQRLARANRELDAFVHAASHDMRTPLAVLGTLVQVLHRRHGEALGDDGVQVVERMEETVGRVQGMLEDLLELSRARNRPLEKEAVDVSALARDVAADVDEQVPDRSARWDIEDGLTARADAGLLRVLFQNLLGNALKYAGRGRTAHVAVRQEQGEQGSFFVVADDGPGFEPDAGDRIFEAFFRLDEEGPGTGIGLSTVRRIVERHGGRVWAESRPGEGARFCFTLDGV